ncbi:50S ribosomal protein L20 [Candidatus Vampirococcus lugosii]|uniref:Large ribosomal subunit protein bL20 n=1 Tax=Candidatus Vampirococcus lugosii TaxID=2789015 RepID=A0ABS5QK82_9BACT|nr:50S ribosomal protein L20 [Candidatus Vampirococcus lugosii]
MVRVTNGFVRHRRHKKFLKQAKGFRLGRKNVYKQVRLALIKQGQNAYIGRKLKKRQFRQLWIDRLSSALRSRGSKYSVFINQLKTNNVVMNRKVLSNIAVVFPEVFDKINEEISK